MQLVGRWDGEVAFFEARAVAVVFAAAIGSAVPDGFVAVEEVVAAVGGLVEAYVAEEEEFGFWSEVGGVGDAAGFEVGVGFACDVAWVAAVGLACEGVVDVADEAEGGYFECGVDEGGAGIGEDEHVAFVDGLEAAY